MARDFSRCPRPEDIRRTRIEAGLTQTEAGKLVQAALGTWQHWEYGLRRMSAEKWDIFCRLTKSLRDEASQPLDIWARFGIEIDFFFDREKPFVIYEIRAKIFTYRVIIKYRVAPAGLAGKTRIIGDPEVIVNGRSVVPEEIAAEVRMIGDMARSKIR